jgi:hypothetical protein
VASWFSQPDTDRLGSPDFWTREGAESRLRAYGFLAVPALQRAAQSEEPEVRDRAIRLLAPWRNLSADMRAADVLYGPWEIDPLTFWHDQQLRVRTHRLAVRAGCQEWHTKMILCDDEWNWWMWDAAKWQTASEGLRLCRHDLGIECGWPFR